MNKAFIIHGTEGSPDINWFPWLKEELEKIGVKVVIPNFPTPENQSLKSWVEVFEKYFLELDDNSIIIGHSLGPSFILSILEKIKTPIKSAFFVAGFTGALGNSHYDKLNETIAKRKFDWSKIRGNCRRFYVINSDNDPYVPLDKGKELADNLNTDIIVISKAGHINEESGHKRFEFLLDKIKEDLQIS